MDVVLLARLFKAGIYAVLFLNEESAANIIKDKFINNAKDKTEKFNQMKR